MDVSSPGLYVQFTIAAKICTSPFTTMMLAIAMLGKRCFGLFQIAMAPTNQTKDVLIIKILALVSGLIVDSGFPNACKMKLLLKS